MLETRVLEAAVELFAKHGYAVPLKRIAKRADSTVTAVYRICRYSKERLFDKALAAAIKQSFDPQQFALSIYRRQKYSDLFSVLSTGLQRWYSTISPSSAQLLFARALFSDYPKWQQTASTAVERVISTLVDIINRDVPKTHKFSFDAHTTAYSMIMLLLQRKSTPLPKGRSPKAKRVEAKKIELLVVHTLRGLLTALR